MLGYDVTSTDRIDILGNHLEKFNNYNGRPISREEIASDLLHITLNHRINDRLNLTVLGNYLDSEYDGSSDAQPAHEDSADSRTRVQQWPNRDLGVKVVVSGHVAAMHSFSTGVEWRRSTSSNRRFYGHFETLEFDVNGTQDIYSRLITFGASLINSQDAFQGRSDASLQASEASG